MVILSTICYELLSNWTDLFDYLTKYAMPQETQGVKKIVSNSCTTFLLINGIFLFFQPQHLKWAIVYDEFFPSRLVLLKISSRLLVISSYNAYVATVITLNSQVAILVRDTSIFGINLSSRRDWGFSLYKESCQYLMKLDGGPSVQRVCQRKTNCP